jgi:Ca2+-binding EF-hand superfamily protein
MCFLERNEEKRFIQSPQGSLEFFQRTVFRAFDTDNNGVLDNSEMDAFVNLFYEANSIFRGDARLPENKDELKQMIREKFDINHDGVLTFEELRALIAGKVKFDTEADSTNETNLTIALETSNENDASRNENDNYLQW